MSVRLQRSGVLCESLSFTSCTSTAKWLLCSVLGVTECDWDCWNLRCDMSVECWYAWSNAKTVTWSTTMKYLHQEKIRKLNCWNEMWIFLFFLYCVLVCVCEREEESCIIYYVISSFFFSISDCAVYLSLLLS